MRRGASGWIHSSGPRAVWKNSLLAKKLYVTPNPTLLSNICMNTFYRSISSASLYKIGSVEPSHSALYSPTSTNNKLHYQHTQLQKFINSQQRSFTTTTIQRQRLKRLKDSVEKNPNSADAAAYMKELGKHDAKEAIKFYEKHVLRSNLEATKEYLVLLSRTGKLDSKIMDKVFIPGQFASTSSTSASTSTSNSDAGLATIASELRQWRNDWAEKGKNSWVGRVFGLVIYLGVFYLIFSQFRGGHVMDGILGSNTGKVASGVDVTFADVKGIDEAKDEVKEVVEYLKNPERFEAMGAKMPKGILLVGPPGTGKTLLARAMAGEAGVPFYYTSASEFDEVFVGVGPARIRKLFEKAKQKQPAIIFIDELDAIGKRGGLNDVHTGSINQLLSVLDGFETNTQIVVMGATNHADKIDTALIRPGRFDKTVTVPLPDVRGRKEILEHYLSRCTSLGEIDTWVLAKGTPGFSGADLENLVNRAIIKATIKGQTVVGPAVLDEAKDDIIMGVARPSLMLTEEAKQRTAFHEGGHALVSVLSKGAMPLHKVTILPRGMSLGATHSLNTIASETEITCEQLLAMMRVAMGGRAAEELMYGKEGVSSGAMNDFEQATNIAFMMVEKYGMSDNIGKVSYRQGVQPSSETRRQMEIEIQRIVNEQYELAKQLLVKHKDALSRIASSLIEYEMLSGEEIKLISQGKKLTRSPDQQLTTSA